MRDYLRAQVPLTATECEVTEDGQPLLNCGEKFVAIHAGEWRGLDTMEGLEESYGAEITVTLRAARVPRDRIGPNLLVGPTGQSLDELLERIRALLHLDKGAYPVLHLANTTIGGSANGFVEPLRFRDGGRPESKGPEWFSALAEQSGLPVGLAQTLSFGDAKRYQTIESDT